MTGFVWSLPPMETARGGHQASSPWELRADASLYYLSDLRGRLPGVRGDPPDASDNPAAPLIARALAAGGADALTWLEGDFALAAWHAGERRALLARDFGGKRALFYALGSDQRLWVATSVDALLAAEPIPRALHLAAVATSAAGMWGHGAETAYRGVFELPAGHALHWSPGTAPRVERFWHPPDRAAARRAPLDDAATELRALLESAVRERLPADGVAAVTLSGGWDSTAIYGTARALGHEALAVSISYPEGDPGREDEYIAQVLAQWEATGIRIDINDIPLFPDWRAAAAGRALPFAHAYETWNRSLSRHAAAAGARVVLDGIGGDQLFQVSDIYLADLMRTLQWSEALRQAKARSGGQRPLMHLLQWGVLPNLPRGLVNAAAALRGAPPPPDYLERMPPRWFRRDFLARERILERERDAVPRRTARQHVAAEAQAYLMFAFYPRIFALLQDFARAEGVELRSPLLDARVVDFALRRPWSDRADGNETKRLLRAAMRGRLPDDVLAPRAQRTGTTNAYFLRELRRAGWPVAQELLPTMRLAALGIIEPSHYERAWQHVLQHDDDELATRVFFTLQAELWLQTHSL